MANDKYKSEKIEDVKEKTKRPVGRPPLEFPEPINAEQEEVENVPPKKSRIPRDYFKIDASPEDVARVIMNTKPKKRGEWDFEKRD